MSNMTEPLAIKIPGPRVRLEENEQIRELVFAHLAEGHNRLVLDFSGVEFVDSSFLGLLVVVLKRSTTSGGEVRLCSLQDPIRNVFELMRLDRLFEIYDTQEAAKASFR